MLKKLEINYNQLNDSLKKALDILDHLPEEKLHQAPADHWSAAQILHHLYLSESGTVKYLGKKMQAKPKEVKKGGLFESVRAWILSKSLRNYKRKYKAPKAAGEVPPRPDYTATRDGYLELRKQMRELLGRFDTDMLNKTYFKHPAAGRLTIVHTLQFMQDHFDRHWEQMKARSQ